MLFSWSLKSRHLCFLLSQSSSGPWTLVRTTTQVATFTTTGSSLFVSRSSSGLPLTDPLVVELHWISDSFLANSWIASTHCMRVALSDDACTAGNPLENQGLGGGDYCRLFVETLCYWVPVMLIKSLHVDLQFLFLCEAPCLSVLNLMETSECLLHWAERWKLHLWPSPLLTSSIYIYC